MVTLNSTFIRVWELALNRFADDSKINKQNKMVDLCFRAYLESASLSYNFGNIKLQHKRCN